MLYDLKEYTISLVKELVYIDDIESNYLQNEIDYSTFDQKEFDNVKICKYCNCEFNHPYNDRYIILYEICDKEKLKYILENNDFNEEVNNLARNYYDSFDTMVVNELFISKLVIKTDIMVIHLV